MPSSSRIRPELVGVIDNARTRPFFGLPVQAPERVNASVLDGQPFDRLVVMSFDTKKTRATLNKMDLTPQRVFWI